MSLINWSWLFLVMYIGIMCCIGFYAQRKIKSADDFATARGSYGPFFLALAYAATTASGATFLGLPALAYQWGTSSLWYIFLYPVGVYIGVLISMRLVSTVGERFGNRSIPEYLGERYQSDGIRILVALMSLILLFYLIGQLVSGLVMFQLMLGLEKSSALIITTLVLLFYVVMGGAHADILSDGIQGGMMLILAIIVVFITLNGVGLEGGLSGLIKELRDQDPLLTDIFNSESSLFSSWWSVIVIVFAHIPLGLLPHLGNKIWALKSPNDRTTFIWMAASFGLTLSLMGIGGFLARAHFGEDLLTGSGNPNQALPLLFIEIFPSWLAALIGIGILSAVMSTADGLVISSSQIIANDLYRKTYIPKRGINLSESQIDRNVLNISRLSTILILILCAFFAQSLINKNVALIVWIGIGGMMAAFSGPLILGALWRGVTKIGAYAGLISGMATFIVLHAQLINPIWFINFPYLHSAANWLVVQGPNPFACTFIGEIVSTFLTYIVSKATRKLPEEHLEKLF